MRTSLRTVRGLILAAIVFAGALALDLSFVGRAEAVVGRPATPISYAGVARRTTRRTVAVAGATGPYNPYVGVW